MKILMMTNSYFPYLGGLEQSLHSFSKELRKLGHEVLIAAPGPAGRTDKKENVVRLPAFHHVNGKGIEFSINLPLPGEFSRIMNEFRPDIIHSHYPFFMGDFAVRLSRQYHVPLVFSYHIMFEHYVHYLPIRTEGIKRFLITLACGYANMSQHVIAPSQSVRDILVKRRVTSPITVVPTGVNIHLFAKGRGKLFRWKNRIPPDAVVIGHVSRLAPEKNFDFMIPALIEVLKKDERVHALIVGRGPSVPMIRRRFKEAGLSKRLHLPGYLDGQDLIDAYHAMDVFAFASLSETQGIVLIEALAAGVPVVAINVPGVREVVKNNVNGRLISKPDQKKFIEVLGWILKQPETKSKMMKQQAIIIAPGFYNSKQAFLLKQMAQSLNGDYDVIVFDFRGHGQSEALFYWTSREYLDLLAIVEFTGKNYQKVGVIGFSMGAATGIIAAAKTKGIHSVVAVSGPSEIERIDYHFWKINFDNDLFYNWFGKGSQGKGVRMGPFWHKKEKPIDLVKKMKAPIFYIHGSMDWVVRPWHSHHLHTHTSAFKRLEIIEKGQHAEFLFKEHKDRMLNQGGKYDH